MTRPRAAALSRWSLLLLLLLAVAADAAAGRADTRLLQTPDASTPSPAPTNSSASGSEDRADRPPVASGGGGGGGAAANAGATLPPSATGDSTATTSGGRDSGFDTEGIVGIVVGGIVAVALVVAFVRVGSSRRKTAAAQEQQLQHQSQDLAGSAMSIKSVKFVESFDSSSTDTPTAGVRKPAATARVPSAQNGSSYHSLGSSNGPFHYHHQQQQQSADAGLDFSIEDVFTPSRVPSLSRSQRSVHDRSDSLKKPSLSPESYLKLAHSNSRTSALRQSRRSRHSRSVEDATAFAASGVAAASPVRSSRLRFSRSSIQSTDSTDVPMLGGGGGNHRLPSNLREEEHDDDDRESTRDIPVLARGSEESVDSVEDEDIEISI